MSVKLQANMPCDYLCSIIQQAIIQYQRENNDMNDTLLVIDIKKPTDDSGLIPKLEYNNNPT